MLRESSSQEPQKLFCKAHDERLLMCLCVIMKVSPAQPEEVPQAATKPLVLGGMGLKQARRVNYARDFGQEMEIGRSQNWPKSKLAEIEQVIL